MVKIPPLEEAKNRDVDFQAGVRADGGHLMDV